VAEAGFRVTGRVQGVGYRWWARSLGSRLGLSGTVRNLDDGAVVVQARGEEAAVEALRRHLAQGPPLAHVAGVEEVPFVAAEMEEGRFTAIR
jgi:acylphosphatase